MPWEEIKEDVKKTQSKEYPLKCQESRKKRKGEWRGHGGQVSWSRDEKEIKEPGED